MDALLRSYAENNLLTYASAISFQVFLALIPLGLFALALLGFLSLEEVWSNDIAPDVRENVSRAAFTIIRRFSVSCGLAAVVGALLLGAATVGRFGGSAVEAVLGAGAIAASVGFVLRWGVVFALLLVAIGMLAHFAPAKRRPARWVSFGTLLSVAGWVVMSLIFSWYVTSVADYGSIFGSLATVIVAMEYLYLSAIVFLTGIQIDSLARSRLEGT